MKLFLWLSLTLSCCLPVLSQYKINDSCVSFSLTIEAKNIKTDSIRFTYNDCIQLGNLKDTVVLINGKTTITGIINRATEAILYTSLKSRWIDGPGVIRFILEPGNMNLAFSMNNDTVRVDVIDGPSEIEKEEWEADNASLLEAIEIYRNKIIQLVQQKDKGTDTSSEQKINVFENKFDVLKELLITQILKYVNKNPDSYVSGYLLDHYQRSIRTDTLETYFCKLPPKVIYSDFGKYILSDLFKLSDDWTFRRKFTDSLSYERLKKVKSIYDISLTNLKGSETSFSAFKGKFLLIDFWASWCKPCIRNAPYLEKLNAEMKGKPFNIISVSIDADSAAWKKSIKKYEFPGIHLFDKYGTLSTFYKVLWVPRYIIIKPDGTVANLDAPQANDPELKNVLNTLLAGKK